MNVTPAPGADSQSALIAGYRPKSGVADELFDSHGQMRPVWAPLIEHLSLLSSDQIDAHFSRGANYLRDAGVYFRHYATTPAPERDWPLSPVPVLIHESEWTEICDGLAQRANLLEDVVADLYGEGRLVSEGHLPAELIANSPAWLRPLVGITPASGHFLHLLSFEISRNPDGTWFVLGDRAQAPSGAGFALENRMATARIFNDLQLQQNIHRLAGFFRSFRETMDALPGARGGRTAILTPGPNNASYFEHTYIARYLGLLLLEGEDMLVADGQVMVRTVKGPLPVGALWRRVDSEYLDPLELREDSQLGIPGLMSALRGGKLSMINALGTGVLEMRAMMAFLPRISEVLTGEPLKLPNIATWWCGQPAERDHVKANLDRMLIGGARDQDLPFDVRTAASGGASDETGGALGRWIEAEAGNLVGQEVVTLSTAPAYHEGKLVPRPMTVRVTAARTPGGWTFMPGGYARIGASDDATALATQKGGEVADVWVVSDAPVHSDTLLTDMGLHPTEAEALPSRAAENFFWLGRYVERTEMVLRLVRAYHLRLAETADRDTPRLAFLATYLGLFGIDVSAGIPSALEATVGSARLCASKVRDRFSTDGWAALKDLEKTVGQMKATVQPGDNCARAMGVLLRKLSGFSGLVHENMYRSLGWRFLSFGHALEHADAITSILAACAAPDAPQGAVDMAIEIGDSVMSHRRRFHGEASRESAIDLIATDADNPASILFQLNRMVDLAGAMSDPAPDHRPSTLTRALKPLQTKFAVTPANEFGIEDLQELRIELAKVSDLLSAEYLR